MLLDAVCVIQGPGDIGLYQKDGVLYIYTKDKIDEVPADGQIATILPGYNRFYLGEADAVRAIVYGDMPKEEVEVEI